MTVFPTPANMVSWAKYCPQIRESAGRRLAPATAAASCEASCTCDDRSGKVTHYFAARSFASDIGGITLPPISQEEDLDHDPGR